MKDRESNILLNSIKLPCKQVSWQVTVFKAAKKCRKNTIPVPFDLSFIPIDILYPYNG